ncbi:unnamed protein product [Larinioides sclopetarius]|uniref:Uncharacterized protein n=1 Tax=Larinioides sclopetarius TaxID=280406 RepID=A0AAV2BQ55_9ARAC
MHIICITKQGITFTLRYIKFINLLTNNFSNLTDFSC